MGIAEGLVLCLDLVFEVAPQIIVGLIRKFADAVLSLQLLLGHIAQFVVVRRRQAEGVLEAVLHSRVALQEVVESLRQSCNDDNGVVVPFVHLHEQLVQRIHLIGILIGQEFLHIIEEEYSTLRLLDVVVPLVHEALIVDSIHHRELRLLDDLMLVEVVAYDSCQCRLTRTCLAYDDSIHRQAHYSDVFTRAQVGIGVNDGLQLCLHIGQANQLVEGMTDDRLSAPLAELGHASVFLMTKVTCHIASLYCCIYSLLSRRPFYLQPYAQGSLASTRLELKMMNSSTRRSIMIDHST